MLSDRKITAHRGETLEGTVAKGHPQRSILLPLLCCLVVDKVIERLDGNGCHTLWLCAIIREKLLITVTELHQVLSMEQWCDRKCFLFRMWVGNCMNLRAAKKIKYGHSAWVTSVPTLLIFYSIIFCSILCVYYRH
jgi:hypothetical protein